MIKFDSFIKSIHAAILSANDALMDKNLELLKKFFEETDGDDEFQRTLDEAQQAIEDIVEDRTPGKEKLRTLVKALEGARETLAQKDVPDVPETGPDRARLPDKLKPKMTTIQYPQKTANGVVMIDVRVPLITLVPLSMTQISEVRLRTELEIQVGEQELSVSFPAPQSGKANPQGEESQVSRPIATLDITLTPHHGTEGLRKIVEGYEKVLRAQIPH